MKLSTIAILFVILGVAIYIQAMPTHDAPDTIPQTKPVEAQHQFPNLEVMGERKKRCNWNSDPTTTTAGYSDPDFGHPPKAWDPVEPFAKNNKYFGTTRSPIRRRRSMDGMKFNYTILK
ncbi:uncharacterized protein LOC113560071 [Rhopalosiphum maidis]|uniref:uncharacterized protein LOC113560071 n=1 Tax=Rhopalosiphum maidis TaxID=43146 RepID=UPI000EFE3851|nr:uncharacterized protein LOC113560071 [Rhopalosiphum maidis]